jgi:serralysin
MASFTLTTVTEADQTLLSGEIGLVTETGANLGVITMADAVLLNHGTVFATESAIRLTAGGAYIENHGAMTGSGSGVISAFDGSDFLVRLELVNYGSIMARSTADASAIITVSGANRIFNHGIISASESAAIKLYDFSINTSGFGNFIFNDGLIESSGFAAISIANDAADRLQNSGRIVGDVVMGSGNDAVLNSGKIDGNVTFGDGDVVTLRNSGTITGDVVFSLAPFSQGNQVFNSGTIAGKIMLYSLNDRVDVRGGMVTGGIQDFDGNDIYLIDDSRQDIDDAVGGLDKVISWVSYALGTGIEVLELRGTAVDGRGNDLANTLIGNGLDNVLLGAEGNDTVNGGAGNDRLRGDGNSDVVNGDTGEDDLRGGAQADTLNGGEGDDTLQGDGGSDRLVGDEGADLLIGGEGRDTLTGGADGDVFRFRSLGDCGVGGGLRDVIIGFEAGIDLIDLMGMDAKATVTGNQGFAWIGTAVFGNVAGQLRLSAGANSVLQGDVNGDGVADFEVQLSGVATVSVNDILL